MYSDDQVLDNETASFFELIRLEALCILTNLASGTGLVRDLIDVQILPALKLIVQACCSNENQILSNMSLLELAVQCYGNIMNESFEFRDAVLSPQQGVIDDLIKALQMAEFGSTLQLNCIWSLSGFLKGSPPAKLMSIKPALKALIEVLVSTEIPAYALSNNELENAPASQLFNAQPLPAQGVDPTEDVFAGILAGFTLMQAEFSDGMCEFM